MNVHRQPSDKKAKIIVFVWKTIPYLILLTLIVSVFIAYAGIQEKKKQIAAEKKAAIGKEKPGVNVVTLHLSPTLIRDKISFPGSIDPWVRLEVLAEVSGRVMNKEVDEGKTVEKGKVIARLDKRDYENAYNSILASYKAATATLNRLKELRKGELSTRSQLDDAQAQVDTLKASLDTAKLNLERTVIRAPIKGMVNRVFIDEGQYLNQYQKVVEILQTDRVKVNVGIPESNADAVRKIETFDVTIDALGDRQFKAEKNHFSRTADAMARLYNLELSLPNPGGLILPDMFARVLVVKQEVDDALVVPLYSVINRKDKLIVFVEDGGMVSSREVELGIQEGWQVEITNGLSKGDRVVVVGNRSVSDGQKVNVIKEINDIKELQG